jgi:hypothetical protein
VLVNGAAVLTNVDPYAFAGAKFTPVVREVTVTATGPTMVVSMRTRLDNAALAALEVSASHMCKQKSHKKAALAAPACMQLAVLAA